MLVMRAQLLVWLAALLCAVESFTVNKWAVPTIGASRVSRMRRPADVDDNGDADAQEGAAASDAAPKYIKTPETGGSVVGKGYVGTVEPGILPYAERLLDDMSKPFTQQPVDDAGEGAAKVNAIYQAQYTSTMWGEHFKMHGIARSHRLATSWTRP